MDGKMFSCLVGVSNIITLPALSSFVSAFAIGYRIMLAVSGCSLLNSSHANTEDAKLFSILLVIMLQLSYYILFSYKLCLALPSPSMCIVN